MTTRESMLKFLFERMKKSDGQLMLPDVTPKIQQVLEIKLKEDDDDNGAAGEHYVVKCQMLHWVVTGTSRDAGVFEQYEATCLVDRREFDKFVNKEKAIIWL
jgi:hypothetical protein